jgi:hypothetical protein
VFVLLFCQPLLIVLPPFLHPPLLFQRCPFPPFPLLLLLLLLLLTLQRRFQRRHVLISSSSISQKGQQQRRLLLLSGAGWGLGGRV